MKMSNIRSPWRYDAGACCALRSSKLRFPLRFRGGFTSATGPSIDAMNNVDGTRELAIKSRRAENEQLMVSVSDTGVGLPPRQANQIFNAFFTTKVHGTGMGLSISRSIVASHNGRLWAADNSPRGAIFHLILPTKVGTHE
jgi:signal transduction histidine kinase